MGFTLAVNFSQETLGLLVIATSVFLLVNSFFFSDERVWSFVFVLFSVGGISQA